VSFDEQAVTTSEGQGYAMLRAVWSNDRKTFEEGGDGLNVIFKSAMTTLCLEMEREVLSLDTATDADTDIALP